MKGLGFAHPVILATTFSLMWNQKFPVTCGEVEAIRGDIVRIRVPGEQGWTTITVSRGLIQNPNHLQPGRVVWLDARHKLIRVDTSFS